MGFASAMFVAVSGCSAPAPVGTGAVLRVVPRAIECDGPSSTESEPRQDEILIPGGHTWLGCGRGTACYPEEPPPREVLLKPYFIDRTEMSQGNYQRCSGAEVCIPTPAEFVNQFDTETPVRWLRPRDAANYCEWVGKRLCTEDEWEAAARGFCADTSCGDDADCCRRTLRWYPWGDEAPDCHKVATMAYTPECEPGCNCFIGPVGQLEAGASPFGVLDLAGGAAEITATKWDDVLPGGADDEGATSIVKGGLPAGIHIGFRSTMRSLAFSQGEYSSVGFRCCRSLPE